MRIDVFATDGSPLGIVQQDIYGELPDRLGVGGSELAIFNLLNIFHNAGHEVCFYNNPRVKSTAVFEQRNQADFNPQADRDVLIIFRTANTNLSAAKGMKVFYTHDQWTMDIYPYNNVNNFCQKVVAISPYHADYLKKAYQLNNVVSIDLPVNTSEYDEQIEKIPNRCLFSSVPDRGLHQLRDVWDRIVARVPDASLVITSDYRLWNSLIPLNEQYRARWIGVPNIIFKGAVRRKDLIREQLQSQVLSYCCTYPELFCYAIAEAQVAGCYPVTNDISCLGTTNMGSVVPGDARNGIFRDAFVEEIVYNLQHSDELKARQVEVQKKARERFSPENILKQWNELVFNKG
jgi:glycosyltransferase involved in cell wall biosynthesis